MALVKSVQRHTITLGPGVASDTVDLTDTPATDTSNCIPFITTRNVTWFGAKGWLLAYTVDAYFTAGEPNKVTVEVGNGNLKEIVVELTVVEFNSAEVKIQQGLIDIADSALSDSPTGGGVDFDNVVPTATFLYHTYMGDGTSQYFDDWCIRGDILGTSNIEFSREGDAGLRTGHWYLAEALSSEFTVEHVPWTLTGASIPTTVATVTMNKTLLLGSNTASRADNNNDTNTVDTRLTDVNEIIPQRDSTVGTMTGVTQVIEFTGNENIQRGGIDAQGATSPDYVSITSVDLEVAQVHCPGCTGAFTTGSFPGSQDTDVPDAFCAFTFEDSGGSADDSISVQHMTAGGEANNDIGWEVIEWALDTGEPPASKRILVVS